MPKNWFDFWLIFANIWSKVFENDAKLKGKSLKSKQIKIPFTAFGIRRTFSYLALLRYTLNWFEEKSYKNIHDLSWWRSPSRSQAEGQLFQILEIYIVLVFLLGHKSLSGADPWLIFALSCGSLPLM